MPSESPARWAGSERIIGKQGGSLWLHFLKRMLWIAMKEPSSGENVRFSLGPAADSTHPCAHLQVLLNKRLRSSPLVNQEKLLGSKWWAPCLWLSLQSGALHVPNALTFKLALALHKGYQGWSNVIKLQHKALFLGIAAISLLLSEYDCFPCPHEHLAVLLSSLPGYLVLSARHPVCVAFCYKSEDVDLGLPLLCCASGEWSHGAHYP